MNYLDYLVIASYTIGFLFLGKLFNKNKSGNDYFLGGKSFTWFPLTLSTVATQLSAISFISAPAFVGISNGGGMKWLTYEFGVPIAMIVLMVVLIPPMYKAGVVSVYGFLEKRFGASTRVLLSIVFQFSRAFATSVMIYTAALILTSVMTLPLWSTIVIMGVVTLIYSYQGGMKAVVYGDMIQMIILMIGIGICLFAGLNQIGGWEEFSANVDPARLEVVDFGSLGLTDGEGFGFWPMLVGGMFLYISYYGTDQSQVQRLFSAKDLATVNKTILANGLIRFPITLSYCIMGLVIGTLAISNPEFMSKIPSEKPDLMVPIFIRDYLPHGVIGILMVTILAGAMSSLSSTINSLSAASVEDLFNRNKDLDTKTYMKYSKIAALFWGLFCLIFAFFVGGIAPTVIEAINKIGSVFYGPIMATFISALLLRKVNTKGINIGLITGVSVNIYLWLFVPNVFWFWWNAIGAAVTLTIGLLASNLFKGNYTSSQSDIGLELNTILKEKTKVGLLLIFFLVILWFSITFQHMI
ncbi:sodium:solute symporter [Reichenbachiella versicolor]|uniref:sodium:solute symporter n=1 Tax=Reichenbachiella versicolor TaxID=1821036 RepID=UPI000D6E3BF9|nr:sodium:solute symporter [Reichenbachiella versicolor]